MGFTLHTLRVLEAFLSISYAGSPHKNHSTAVMALMMVVEVVKVLMMILNVCFLIFQMRKHFTNLVWLWDYPFSLLVSSPVGSNKAGGAWIKLWPQINEQFWFYFGHKLIAMFANILRSSQRKLRQGRVGTPVLVFLFELSFQNVWQMLSWIPILQLSQVMWTSLGGYHTIIKIFKRERVRYMYIRMHVTVFGFRPYFQVKNV